MVTETSTVPWSTAQPYIKSGLQSAQDLYNTNAGFKAPSFQTYVPMSGSTQDSLTNMWNLAGQGNPLAGQSMGALSGILSGDTANRYGNILNSSTDLTAAQGNQYNQVYGSNAATAQRLGNQYNQLYSQAGNPYFDQAVQTQADQTAADVQRQFGSLGRIGSTADTGALAQQIGDVRTKALSDQWNQNIANQANILGGASNMYNQYSGNQGNLLSGQNSLYSNYASNYGNILNAQQTGQLNAVGAAPGAYQQQYLPAQALGQVGTAYDDLATRALQSQIDTFNTNQQSGWNRLGAYTGAVSGTGATQPAFSSVQQPSNVLGSLLGGALGGASIGKSIGGTTGAGYGALAGGALGGISSLFGF